MALETPTKTIVGTKDSGIVVIGLTVLLIRGILTSVLLVRKTVVCFKHYLMVHTSRSIEDTNAENLNCGGLTQVVSEVKKFSSCLEMFLVIFW